ncbi:alpha/beta-hydrolase [Tothia fuscella]|uniref:Alpha/beta-hydrolase n=1 Tax=Tothia fuscella TaxID=1048955 RepID=A0A9P4TYJ8_9PEZI|nr:alpha/beta-hydrolase [Tothia fuscella]
MRNYLTSLLAMLTAARLVLAAPPGRHPSIAPRAPAVPPTVSDYNNLRLYAQYAAAAYCNANNGGSINPTPQITCAGALMVNGGQSDRSNCPLVESAGATRTVGFNLGWNLISNTTNGFGTAGFVAVDNVNRLIVLSFRGTDPRSSQSLNTNVQALTNAQIPLPQNCPNCLGADGYLRAFRVVNNSTGLARVDVIGTIQQLASANRGYQVVVTGHSLGGAVGTFAALELRRLGIKVHFASFGMPRAVNPDLANFISAFDVTSETNPAPINQDPLERNFRVVHRGDGTPDLLPLQPFLSTKQYRHLTPSFNITSDNTVLAPAITDVQISSRDGISQLTGVPYVPILNLPTDINATAQAHRQYFGLISACF